jgi:hypothetical protein
MKLQFSLADLAWTVGLLALACAGIGVAARNFSPVHGVIATGLQLPIVMQVPVSLGAGLAAPFRRKAHGAAVAGIAYLLVFLVGLILIWW